MPQAKMGVTNNPFEAKGSRRAMEQSETTSYSIGNFGYTTRALVELGIG